MTEFARGPNGEYQLRYPGERWSVVDEDEYQAARETAEQSAFGRGVGSFVDTVQDDAAFLNRWTGPGGFLGALLGADDGIQVQLDAQAEGNDLRDEVRGRIDPDMQLAGRVATYAVPGERLAQRGAQSVQGVLAARRAARGASPSVSLPERAQAVADGILERTPVGPLIDDAQTGMMRRRMGQEVSEGLARAERQALDDAASTRQGVGAEATEAGRVRWDLMDPDELDAFVAGPRTDLLPAQELALRATTRMDYDNAARILRETELMEQTQPGIAERILAGDRENLTGVQATLQEQIDATFLREIGADPTDGVVTLGTVGDRLDVIGRELDEIANKAGPISGERLPEQIQEVIDENALSKESRYIVKLFQDLIETKTDDVGQISAESHQLIRNRLTKRINQAIKSQVDTELADALDEVRDLVNSRIMGQLSWEDMNRDLELRRQYKLARSAVENRAAISKTGSGLNIVPYNTSLGRVDPNFKAGKKSDPFSQFLRTMEFLQARKTPSSGTAERLSRMRR